MANVAALLAQYQAVKSQISFYTLEQIKWQNLHDTMAEKVSTWQGYEEKWNSASDDYVGKYDENGKFEKKGKNWLKYGTKTEDGGVVWSATYIEDEGTKEKKDSGTGDFPGWGNFKINTEAVVPKYANLVCPQFAGNGSDKLEEYTNLDMEYSAMLTTMETMLASLRGQEESLKTVVGEGAKDTGMGTGG